MKVSKLDGRAVTVRKVACNRREVTSHTLYLGPK
jgi:hypothetical protein